MAVQPPAGLTRHGHDGNPRGDPTTQQALGAAAEGSRPTGDRCTLGTPDDRQAASRVSGAAVHVRTRARAE